MAESTPRAPSARVFASTTPLIVAMLLLTGSVDARAADAPGWTDGLKRAAVMGCRQSIIDTALAKVAKRANKPVGSIPRAERDRMIGMMDGGDGNPQVEGGVQISPNVCGTALCP